MFVHEMKRNRQKGFFVFLSTKYGTVKKGHCNKKKKKSLIVLWSFHRTPLPGTPDFIQGKKKTVHIHKYMFPNVIKMVSK